jgi:hypothetical protein
VEAIDSEMLALRARQGRRRAGDAHAGSRAGLAGGDHRGHDALLDHAFTGHAGAVAPSLGHGQRVAHGEAAFSMTVLAADRVVANTHGGSASGDTQVSPRARVETCFGVGQ